jgi:transcriptional regulator
LSALLPGTLDLLILKTLSLKAMHGCGIAQRLQQLSQGVLDVGESSLYPALQRLLLNGWVKAEWGESENKRRARYYTLTVLGRRRLAAERAEFQDRQRHSTGPEHRLGVAMVSRFLRRLAYLWRQQQLDDLRAELEFHREMKWQAPERQRIKRTPRVSYRTQGRTPYQACDSMSPCFGEEAFDDKPEEK